MYAGQVQVTEKYKTQNSSDLFKKMKANIEIHRSPVIPRIRIYHGSFHLPISFKVMLRKYWILENIICTYVSIKHFNCVIDHFTCNLRVFAAAHDLNTCRTQQIHATQSFFFAGHFISRQFSFCCSKILRAKRSLSLSIVKKLDGVISRLEN
jgi:hypothetical protein